MKKLLCCIVALFLLIGCQSKSDIEPAAVTVTKTYEKQVDLYETNFIEIHTPKSIDKGVNK